MIDKILNLTRRFQASPGKVFKYFVEPHLIERWSAPEGTTLKVPQMDKKEGGNYVYEHTSEEGVFVCNGRFKEFVPNEKLVMVESVKAPNGKLMIESQTCTVEFIGHDGLTDVHIQQDGFSDPKFFEECMQSWNFCLNKLEDLVDTEQKRNVA